MKTSKMILLAVGLLLAIAPVQGAEKWLEGYKCGRSEVRG